MISNDSPHHASRSAMGGRTIIAALAVAAFLAAAAGAASAEDVARGKAIWADKAGCQECHGWSGDGHGGLHSEGKAPSLRETQLTRDEIRMTIQCGRPTTPMPYFDRFSYTDKRCYDVTLEDLGDQAPNRAATTLQAYEIDALADYVATKVKGAGPVMRGQCLDYFGAGAEARCTIYPER